MQPKAAKVLSSAADRSNLSLVGDCENPWVQFVDDRDIERLRDYIVRCKEAGLETHWVESGLEDFNRLRAANIHTPQELRCALRELVPHLARNKDDDPAVKAEQELIGTKIPRFFPTPKAIISRMLELAEIEPGNRVLEPSAGKGDILDIVREHYVGANVNAIELNAALHDILAAKGHDVQQGDFLEHHGQYDRVVMNPPFENGQDIDHVRHAFEQLAPGGQLVSVMSAGPFLRSDRKAEEFREWLEALGHTVEDLPEDAFQGIDAFRQTGVRTKLLLLSKSCS